MTVLNHFQESCSRSRATVSRHLRPLESEAQGRQRGDPLLQMQALGVVEAAPCGHAATRFPAHGSP
jgi:hypothetical protein